MSRIQRFDPVGITVADLDTATAFFVGLGCKVEGTFVEGRVAVDTIPGALHTSNSTVSSAGER